MPGTSFGAPLRSAAVLLYRFSFALILGCSSAPSAVSAFDFVVDFALPLAFLRVSVVVFSCGDVTLCPVWLEGFLPWFSRHLSFDYAALGLLDELDQHGYIFALIAFGAQSFQGLRSVAF